MINENTLMALAGGALIGLAATILLLFNGRIAGISGIISGLMSFSKTDRAWQTAFLAGMLSGGAGLMFFSPGVFVNLSGRGLGVIAAAGLLVGFGTAMGSGCTSGHGVCGVSRLSPRSILATGTFIIFGILAVTAVRFLLGGAQ